MALRFLIVTLPVVDVQKVGTFIPVLVKLLFMH